MQKGTKCFNSRYVSRFKRKENKIKYYPAKSLMGVTNGFQIGVFICYRIKYVTFSFPKYLCLYLVFIFKSLLEVFIKLMPNICHRSCIKHMHANFMNNGLTRKTLKEIMWDTKRAYKNNKYTYYMDGINSISNKVQEFLFEFYPRDWHRNVN